MVGNPSTFQLLFLCKYKKIEKKSISFDRKTIKLSDIVELPYTKILVLNVTDKIFVTKQITKAKLLYI